MTGKKQNSWTETGLAGGGELGARMRALDWTATPLGAVETWPQSLRSVVSMLLPSKAQSPVLGTRVRRPLQRRVPPRLRRQTSGRARPSRARSLGRDLGYAASRAPRRVVRTGEAFWAQDFLFLIERHGFAEETYFDVSYDPVRVESGGVGGVYCIVTETTERVVGERRMALLRELAARQTPRRGRHAKRMRWQWRRCRASGRHHVRLGVLGDELQDARPAPKPSANETRASGA